MHLGHIAWYEAELAELKSSPIVNLHVYVTSKSDPIVTSDPNANAADAAAEEDVRRSVLLDDSVDSLTSDSEPSSPTLNFPMSKEIMVHSEKNNKGKAKRRSIIDQQANIEIDTLPGRPDLAGIVTEVVKSSEAIDTIAVGACGPVELMRVARNAVAKGITVSGPSLTLHCEQFGWG